MGELDFENVAFGYNGGSLFDDFSASFAKGEVGCIVGPNGCGKSTLAKLAMGLAKPTSGRVLIQGRDVASLDSRERACRLGVLVQQQEAPMMTVGELAACGRFPHHGPFSRISDEDAQSIDAALSLAGVLELRDRPLQSRSGGQRQRARMAMVLAQGTPIVMLADRQTTGGYAKIATVASVDIPLLVQRATKQYVQFKPVSVIEAQRLLVAERDYYRNVRANARGRLTLEMPCIEPNDHAGEPTMPPVE